MLTQKLDKEMLSWMQDTIRQQKLPVAHSQVMERFGFKTHAFVKRSLGRLEFLDCISVGGRYRKFYKVLNWTRFTAPSDSSALSEPQHS